MTAKGQAKLANIETYLERQTNLAYLEYRRATTTGGHITSFWCNRITSNTDKCYALWIGMSDAQFLVSKLAESNRK